MSERKNKFIFFHLNEILYNVSQRAGGVKAEGGGGEWTLYDSHNNLGKALKNERNY